MPTDQVWTLAREGRKHRVEAGGSAVHRVRWFVDGELLAEKKTMDDKVSVKPGTGEQGQLLVRFSAMGKPRTATLYDATEDAKALTGLGGVDLVPESGSDAAAYEARVLEHPNRYAAVATAGGLAKVVLPILLGLVAVRFAVNLPWPSIPWPDLPSIPWPDLPSVPFPDLPSIPWPDVSVPEWVGWLLDKATYVWPVVLAFVLARAEVKRRRDQDEKRRAASTPDDDRE